MKKLFLASALGALFSLFAFGQASIPIQVYSGPDMAGQCNPAPMAIPNPPMRYNTMDGTYWGCPNSASPYAPLWTQYTQTSGGFLTSDGFGGLSTTAVASTGTGSVVRGTAPALANPVITGPAPIACGATCSPTAGQLILFGTAAGSTATLPTAAATGNVIRIRVTTTTTSAADKVLLTTTTNTIIGTAIGWTGSTPAVFAGNAGTYHSLQMPFTGSQPSGGFIGDTITCTDVAATIWACDVIYEGGTTPTTPYSTSTT